MASVWQVTQFKLHQTSSHRRQWTFGHTQTTTIIETKGFLLSILKAL